MKLITNSFLIGSLLVVPAYASGDHDDSPPAPIQGDANGSNHNVLSLVAVIAAGVCIYHKCWQPKPVKAETGITPEIPQNEFIKVRPR